MMKSEVATTFVGRRRELETLDGRLDLAFAGQGSLAMLAGEAGVGKTRVLQEFSERAAQRGATVLTGSCFEGDWQPPYGPWVEALGQHVRASDPEQLRQRLNGSAAHLAHLVPEIRAALPDTPLPEPLGADEERLRLFDAVRQLLLAATRQDVLVLVLDDLHWADRDSILLLRHLARFVGQARLLVVGAYRDTELDLENRHPLADLLAVLCRETGCEQIAVHPLSFEEVSEYLAQAAGQPLPRALARAIYEEASGNPFYVREVFRHLIEEGKVYHRGGRWLTDTSIAELGIPAGVRQVIGRRVSRLSEETSAMLRVAAGFSGGFEFPVLAGLTELTEDSLLDCLDEALQAGLLRVTEAPGASPTYLFAHAIVRHALYGALKPDRRARLHRRIALAMERVYAGRELEHAAELAWQYWSSASLPDGGKGLQYALAASEQARRGFAPERVVSFLRMARDLAPTDDLSAKADILGRLAVAEAEAFMLEDAQRSVEAALAALGQGGAEPAVGAGLIVSVARTLKQGGASHTVWEPLVERGLALVGERRDLAWARLMLLQDNWEQVSSGMVITGRWLGLDAQAVAIARASGDEDDYAQTLHTFEQRTRAETEAVLALARTWRRSTAILHALMTAGIDFAHRHGALPEAIECFRELLAAGKRYGSIQAQADALAQLGAIQLSLGDLDLAQETWRQAHAVVPRLGAVHRLRWGETAGACCLAYYLEGDWSELAGTTVQFATSPAAARLPIGPLAAAFAALSYVRAGNPAEARRLLECFTPVVERLAPHNITLALSCIVVWELEAAEFAGTYRRAIADLVASGIGYLFLPHELGIARMAALLGRASEAAEYFGRTREKIAADSYRPLRAVVDYDEALSLIRLGAPDLDRVAELLERALAVFADMGMEGWVERARTLRDKVAGNRGERRSSRRSPDGVLTAREAEVVRLIALGKTNKETAAELVVSVATVERHIANIYAKIDARGRADATAYAFTHGLVQQPG
jgi:predicted ATPase/DNA-binding CsgD family transcriptional regulator